MTANDHKDVGTLGEPGILLRVGSGHRRPAGFGQHDLRLVHDMTADAIKGFNQEPVSVAGGTKRLEVGPNLLARGPTRDLRHEDRHGVTRIRRAHRLASGP